MASAGLITSDHINYLIYRYLLESGQSLGRGV